MNLQNSLRDSAVFFFTFLAAFTSLKASTLEYLVSDRATNQVLRYSADDGTFLGALIDDNLATNGGLFLPSAMTIGFEGDLFVTSLDLTTGDGLVLRYDAASGEFLEVFASGLEGPAGLLYHTPSDTLLVGQLGLGLGDSNVIARYDAEGSRLVDLATDPVSGRTGMISTPNGDLLVSSFAGEPFPVGSVLKYDFVPETNEFTFAGIFAQAAELLGANGLVADAQDDVYVASLFGQSVLKFDVEEGSAVGSTVVAQTAYPSGLLISPEGDLLVTSLGNNNPQDPIYGPMVFPGSVFRFNPTNGNGGRFLVGGEEFQPTAILLRPLAGDYNGDGQRSAEDIDALSLAVRDGRTEPKYDLNLDGQVNGMDRTYWVEQLKKTYFGDADLNGEFNSGDFVGVFIEGQYEDAVLGNSTWATGDWNGDGDFDTGDFVLAFEGGGYELGPREMVAAVPEPSTVALAWSALMGLGFRLRRKSRSPLGLR